MINNQIKFVDKWKSVLKTKEINSPDNVLKARDARKAKNILYIDDRIPASSQGCGYPRANRILTYLGEAGYRVTFFPLAEVTPWQPYTYEFQQGGIEVFYGNFIDFFTFAKERENFYDIVFVSRPHNFEITKDTLQRFFPDALIVYDAEALYSTREILKAQLDGSPLNETQIQQLRSRELDLLKNADIIITVSDNERKIILDKISPKKEICVISHPIEIKDNVPGFDNRKDILFVGSFLSPGGPNDDAVLHFVKEIWPLVQKELVCKLFIVGINPPKEIQKLGSSSIIITGFVSDLRDYYDKCRVFIVPHRYAAGIPLKLVEAMSYGIPSVVSELIANQLNLEDGKEVFIAKNSEEYAEKIVMLYQNESTWIEIQRKSFEYIQKNCDPEKMKHELLQLIKDESK